VRGGHGQVACRTLGREAGRSGDGFVTCGREVGQDDSSGGWRAEEATRW
jgi:hypothetical protein